MAGCCVILLICGGSVVCYTLKICAGGNDVSCGMNMLKMANIWFSDPVFFSPSCGMGLDGDGFWREYLR